MLRIRGGKVLLQKDRLGEEFLARIEERFIIGPKPMPASEIQAMDVWAEKSLARIRAGDMEGNFRRHEMIPALLEHYFTTRGLWYRGPKESFDWLKKNEPKVYSAFENAILTLADSANLCARLEKLVALTSDRN